MLTTATQKATKKGLEKSSISTIASVSKTWDVTNNTGTDLVVIDAYLSDASGIEELYQRSLKLFSTSDGKQLIKANETKTVAFNDVHTDSTGNPVDYTILIARADNLFPVKIVELAVNEDGFQNTTVTADDVKLMKLAEDFQQTIVAFPSSDMATAFATALTNSDQEQITAFFKSYPQYAAINLEMVVAVQTYYNRYGFVWAGYNKTQSYIFYTSDGTTKKKLGTITINNGTIAPITNLDAPAGFAAAYTDENHRKTDLYYSNGQFSNDVNSSSPAICLQGLFILKSQLTGQKTDNIIIPTLYGVLNNNEVFGYMSDTDQSGKSSIAELLDPQDVTGWLKLLGAILGPVVLLAAIGVGAYLKYKFNKKGSVPNRTPEEIERLNRQKVEKIIERMKSANIKVPENLDTAIKEIKTEMNSTLLENSKRQMNRILNQQEKMCNAMLDYGRTKDMLKAFNAIENDSLEIQAMDLPNLEANLPILKDHISLNDKILNNRYDAISQKLSAREAKLVSDLKINVEKYTGLLDNYEDIRKDLNNDELPEIIEE